MPQRTINLYDGLEALYYFDPTYFDGGANELSDQSGHERHASAIGSPTIGIEGPNDFDATNFDGSDDRFDVAITEPSSLTVSALVKPDQSNTANYGVINTADPNNVGNEGWNLEPWSNVSSFEYGDGSSTPSVDVTSPNGYFAVTARLKSQDFISIRAGDNEDVTNVSTDIVHNGRTGLTIGGRSDFFRAWDGKIAFVGFWSRAISDAEVNHLHSLTAPRRAML